MATIICKLNYEQLNALSGRLDETAETVRNPAVKADITQARYAVSDLASLRFGVEEIVQEMNKYVESLKDQIPLTVIHDIEDFPAKLLELLGYGEE